MSTDTAEGTQETYKQATEGGKPELVKLWLDAIEVSSKDEQDWRKQGDNVTELYRQASTKSDERNNKKFNILHSNIETIVPALYNSVPIPDVRRRFNDTDPVGKAVAQILERALSFSVDSYDFDHVMNMTVKDSELPGRAVARVRYKPYVSAEGDSVDYQEVSCEHVPWKYFRRGPGLEWGDVSWIAFELFLTRDDLTKLSPKLGGKVPLNVSVQKDEDKKDGRNVPEVFKRARVWEIWDKDRRKVLFIAEDYKDAPLVEEDDPLELDGFFPIPRPIYGISTGDSLVPVVPYEIYRAQAEELERISERIIILTEAIKAKSLYDARLSSEMQRLESAEDTDSIPLENLAIFADGTKLADHVMWYPIESIVAALEKCFEAREQIKATIYEITGISDILRGQSQASETATAQNIKQQWGSLRIQSKQAEIQRFARDLFRLKAELFASKFEPQVLSMMTGLSFPSNADKQQAQAALQQSQQTGQPPPKQLTELLAQPSIEDVMQLLRSDRMRGYRVDIESDSTIRADLTRNQQNMTQFLQGTAQFAQGMGPIAMQFPQMMPTIITVFSSFARNFKLGKQADDALDGLSTQAQQFANQPKPPPPEVVAAQNKLAQDQQQHQDKMQQDAQQHQQKMDQNDTQFAQKMALEQTKHQQTLDLKDKEIAAQNTQHTNEINLKATQANADRNLEYHKLDLPDEATGDMLKTHMIAGVQNQVDQLSQALQQLAQVVPVIQQMDAKITEIAQEVSAPVEIKRGRDGKAVQVKKGKRVMNVKRTPDGKATGLQ